MEDLETKTEVTDARSLQERVRQAYSAPTWWYDFRGFFILCLAHRTTLWSQVSFFEKNLRESHFEIPVGSGTLFRFVLWLRRLRGGPEPQVVAVDYSETMVAGTRRAFAGRTNIDVQQGDVTNLDFADNSFHSINIANGLHCFPDPDAALGEIRRVLAPNGSVAASIVLHPRGPRLLRWIASSINASAMRKGLLVAPFELDEVRHKFISHGFTIKEEVLSGNTVNIVATKS